MPDASPTPVDLDAIADNLPAHYFDCDRWRVYGYGARQGDCDCTATADTLALIAELRSTDTGKDDNLEALFALVGDQFALHAAVRNRILNAVNELAAARDRIRELEAENERLRRQAEESALHSIEARNPGIDMDEVRRPRGEVWTPPTACLAGCVHHTECTGRCA